MYKYVINESGLHISQGNSKIGKNIWAFATVPGNAERRPTLKTGEIVTNVAGTCSRYCEGCAKNGACYAWRDIMLYHPTCAKAWSENTNLLRSGMAFDKIDEFIKHKNSNFQKIKTFRINTSGEIENLSQFNGWNDLAIKHPEIIFAVYTKNYDVINEFLTTHNDTADNFVVNISQWNHCADNFLNRHPNKFNVFEYDSSNVRGTEISADDKDRLRRIHHCPAVDARGRHSTTKDGIPITCNMCKRCYTKNKTVTAVYAH